jgi:formylmethanofuran dehydrogenase subunit E
MPESELFHMQPVILQPALETLISKPGLRVNCDHCGEEIINERQVVVHDAVLCRACAGEGYYQPVLPAISFQPTSELLSLEAR